MTDLYTEIVALDNLQGADGMSIADRLVAHCVADDLAVHTRRSSAVGGFHQFFITKGNRQFVGEATTFTAAMMRSFVNYLRYERGLEDGDTAAALLEGVRNMLLRIAMLDSSVRQYTHSHYLLQGPYGDYEANLVAADTSYVAAMSLFRAVMIYVTTSVSVCNVPVSSLDAGDSFFMKIGDGADEVSWREDFSERNTPKCVLERLVGVLTLYLFFLGDGVVV
jgi:hypothetical protein